jgi:hypothetical protein
MTHISADGIYPAQSYLFTVKRAISLLSGSQVMIDDPELWSKSLRGGRTTSTAVPGG